MQCSADMHADTVSKLRLGKSLVQPYNFPREGSHILFTAAFGGGGAVCTANRIRKVGEDLTLLHQSAAREGVRILRTCADAHAFSEKGGKAILLSIEGGGFIPEEEPMRRLFRRGVRVCGLVWDRNELGGGSGCAEGLSEAGKRAARLLRTVGWIPDVSHLSDRSFDDLCRCTDLPLLATHSNFRAVCGHSRNLTDRQAKIIAERGGLIGICLYPPHVSTGRYADEEALLRHFDHGMRVVGEDALALGLDTDGTDGRYAAGLSENVCLPRRVEQILRKRYSARTAEKIMGTNVIRFLCRHLPDE